MPTSPPAHAGAASRPNELSMAAAAWLDYVAGAPTAVDLSFGRAPARPGDFTPATVPVPVAAATAGKLSSCGGSVDDGWLVTFAALVNRFTGQQEFVIGSPVGTKVVARRIYLPDKVSFEQASGAVDVPDLPPIELTELTRLLTGSAHGPVTTLGYVRGRRAEPWAGADLTLIVPETGQLPVRLGYNARVLESELVTRLAEHLAVLATSVAEQAGEPISAVAVLPENERHRILSEFNRSTVDYSDRRPFAARVAAIAAAAPDSVALTYGAEQLTYAQLDARANQLARHLIEGGVTPGAPVGLFLERSADAVVATLAVLRAGAVVVPLDPADNDDWTAYMVCDSVPAAFVTDHGLAGRLRCANSIVDENGRPPSIVHLDAHADHIAAHATDDPGVPHDPDGLSHIAYTSGSTGLPNGARATHRALVNMMNWMPAAYGITEESHGTWLSAPGFAIGRMEWMPFLAVGAQLHIADAVTAGSPERSRDWLLDKGVTHTLLVTSFARRVCALPWPGETALRHMIVLGEPVRRWPATGLPFEVSISYGATEAAVVTSSYDATTGVRETSVTVTPEKFATQRPSVGRPIANARVYLLDAHRAPVPVGAIGEIHLAGAGVCDGYLNLPAETEETFVANPLETEPDERLFRTGDLGRWRPDGSLEVVGRRDAVTRVRGVLVEVGEVEAMIAGLPGVREVAVVAQGGTSGGRLIGYVVSSDATNGLLEQLRALLPAHQVPSVLVRMDRLPRLTNGKLDRRALPAPTEEQAS
jgi:amino acid adenylation domain-containing protein